MNYLTYPLKVMNITQNYKDGYSHKISSEGTPHDYPIDDNCGSTRQDGYFYCPCDEMIVRKIYGIGVAASNTLWLESTSPVISPLFSDIVTIMITHPEDDQFNNIYIGKKYHRGDAIFLEGKDGFATGNHFHISVGKGKMSGTGWEKNNNGAWVLKTTNGTTKPEDAFFIDNDFTTVLDTKGIAFINLNKQVNNIRYVIADSLNVRVGPGTNYTAINTLPENTRVEILETINNWSRIGISQWVTNEYLTLNEPKRYITTKKVKVSRLNVRKSAGGTVLRYKAPLIKDTLVANMKTNGNWTMINSNRWVFTEYIAG